MTVTLDPAHRAEGLVYLDPALEGLPATHVLLVGVGRFGDAALAPLSSPPASARAMAAWFLPDNGLPGFDNPDRPLGSLSLLLSEGDGAARAFGGPVPEATFANVKRALRAWITRAGRNRASAAVLFMSSHGQADVRRTAVLFEDYGSDPLDAFAGMTEVEQLSLALTTLDPADKLLIFDCCRTPVTLDLSSDRSFGMPLIGGREPPPGFVKVRPNVLRSTRLGAAAYGAGGSGTTLFTGALLDALSGLAASPSDDWRIYSSELSATTEEILRLWTEDGEPLQVPAYESEGKLPIAQIAEPVVVPFLLALPPDNDIATARFRLYRGQEAVPEIDVPGPGDGRPFVRFALEELVPYRITAHTAAGVLIGEMTVKTRMPRLVKTMPRGCLPDTALQVTRTKSAEAGASGAELKVLPTWVRGQPQAPVVRVAPMPSAAAPFPSGPPPAPLGLDVGMEAVIPPPPRAPSRQAEVQILPRRDGTPWRLEPGRWVIRTTRPGAPDIETMVDVEDGDEVMLDVHGFDSGHEWLAPAVMTGLIQAHEKGSEEWGSPAPVADLRLHGTDDAPVPQVSAFRAHGDGRFAVYHFRDTIGERFAMGQAGPDHTPVWADVRGAGWRERCFIPVQGALADYYPPLPDGRPDPWEAEILVDDRPPADRLHVASYVISGRFGTLLAFLARRAFLDAGAALQTIAADIPLQQAVLGKIGNPLAALAAAQIAVATGQTEALDIPDQWLENLAEWFPTLPDGPVILGRHLQRQGLPAADQFAKAHSRGVPVFSLTLDWLSEGLEMTGHPAAAKVRAQAMRTDPTRAFTVMRLTETDP